MRIIVTKTESKKTEEENSTSQTRFWSSVPNPDQEGEIESKTPLAIQTTTVYSSNPHSMKEEVQDEQTSPSKKKKKKRGPISISNNNSVSNKLCDEGYNSSEEYSSSTSSSTNIHTASREQLVNAIRARSEEFTKFQEELRRTKGFIIKKMAEDGNCLFR